MAFAFVLNLMFVSYVISHNDEYVHLNQTDALETTFLNDMDTNATYESLFDNYTDIEYTTTETSFTYLFETYIDDFTMEEYATEYISNFFETFTDEYTIEQEFIETEIPEDYSSFLINENTNLDSSDSTENNTFTVFIYETTDPHKTPSSNDSIYYYSTDLNLNDTLVNMTTTPASTQNQYPESTNLSQQVVDDYNSNSPFMTTSEQH